MRIFPYTIYHSFDHVVAIERFLSPSSRSSHPYSLKSASNGPSHPDVSRFPALRSSLLDKATFPVAKNAAELSCKSERIIQSMTSNVPGRAENPSNKAFALYRRTNTKQTSFIWPTLSSLQFNCRNGVKEHNSYCKLAINWLHY